MAAILLDDAISLVAYLENHQAASLASNQSFERQLERLKIPTFNGNKLEFEQWHAAFETCVDKTALNPQVKMLRLESCLEGKALDTIGRGWDTRLPDMKCKSSLIKEI